MKYDHLGLAYTTSDELCDLLYSNPDIDLSKVYVTDPNKYNDTVKNLYVSFPKLKLYSFDNMDIETFDLYHQERWLIPEEYKELDIAKYVLDKCTTEVELQRVGEELLLYQERNLFNLLKWLKYFVDTMKANNVVIGVGRGSSVASYVLYLIGVHKINSIYYDLNIQEFLK